MIPDPKGNKVYEGKSILAAGKPIQNPDTKATGLCYNEFIVYNVEQVQMRYLFKITTK